MARPASAPHTVRAAWAHHARTRLLPLPCTTADGLSLRYHVALEAMRMGQGNPGAVQTLAAVMLLARMLAHAGHGVLSDDTRSAGERAVSTAFAAGSERGEWQFDDDGYQAMAVIVNLHDFQLYAAPRPAIVAAAEWLERLPSTELSGQFVTRLPDVRKPAAMKRPQT